MMLKCNTAVSSIALFLRVFFFFLDTTFIFKDLLFPITGSLSENEKQKSVQELRYLGSGQLQSKGLFKESMKVCY